jgi:hypothetical protein
MRLLKKFYYDVITTLKAVGGADQVPQAIIPKAALFAFCASTLPSKEGVPSSGRIFLDADNVDIVQNGDDGEAFHTKDFSTDITTATKKKKRRGKNQEDCREKFTTIMFDLKGDATGTSEFYNLMCKFQKQRGRASVSSKPGAPESIRTRGVSDKKKGASKAKKSISKKKVPKEPKKSSRKDKPHDDMSKLYQGDAALRHLQKNGSMKGHILETFNDQSDDRWFMEVENGSIVTDGTGDIQIKKCWWLIANSITERDPQFPNAMGCDIDQVKACGPPNSFTVREKTQVKQVKHAAAGPKTAPVTLPATHFGGSAAVSSKRTADPVEISSDSDSDAPISRGAVKLAKAKAAEAAALQRRVLDTVKEMGKRYDDEPAEPAAKRPKRMKFIDGAWHIPT